LREAERDGSDEIRLIGEDWCGGVVRVGRTGEGLV
jgi:hypothetical protein